MKNSFSIFKKSYYIENIYCSIDINNIEKYLKRIENIEKEQKGKISIILVPEPLVYNENHINWAIFNGKLRFLEKINISKNIFTETLMILSNTNQIKGISKNWYIKKGKNNYFLNILSQEKKINKDVLKKLDVKKITKKYSPKIKEIINYYNIKNKKNIEKEIIEKMALSLF